MWVSIKKIDNISHHALFFDVDFYQHAKDIYDEPQWPKEPLFYANFPSLTDKLLLLKEWNRAFFLIPLAPGINDTEALREYFDKIDRFETLTGQSIKNNIIFKQSFVK
jgi:phytoene desaturase